MTTNLKTILRRFRYPIAVAKVMMRCKDKTDVKRYERILDDQNFLADEKNAEAFMKVLVTDTTLWGGDLWLAFLPNESDEKFLYGLGVETAYLGVFDFVSCGIRESNPVIMWIRHFFANRTSPNQKIDSTCLYALNKSLLPLCNEENMDKLYEAAESVKAIPCEAWGDFTNKFYPFYKELVKKYDLIDVVNTLES